MTLVYINSGDSSVMEAQVLSLLSYYKLIDNQINIFLLQGYRNTYERKVLSDKLTLFDSPVFWFRTWPYYTIFCQLNRIALKKAIQKLILTKDTVFHVRGEKYGSITTKILKSKQLHRNILVDIRGASIEEYKQYYSFKGIRLNNKIRNTIKAYRTLKYNSISLTVVSEALKYHLVDVFGFNKNTIIVNNNIAAINFAYSAEKRNSLRLSLNLNQHDLLLVILNGGGAGWQKDETVITKFLNLGFYVLNLSPRKIELPKVINMTLPHSKVPEYLSSADVAVLWRDYNVVNYVASPSKFSEFVSNGLFIIHNGSVDLAVKYITKTSNGFIVKEIDNISQEVVNMILKHNRESASNTGLEYFGIDNISKQYIAKYYQLCKE